MTPPSRLSRRRLLARSGRAAAALAAAPYFVPSTVLGRGDQPPPSDRVALGFIGVGGRGSALLRNFIPSSEARVVGVCDVKAAQRRRARDFVDRFYRQTGCREHLDFRELLARPDVDAVAVATPDHWHVSAALAVLAAGKDVYCEKPMTLALDHAKALRAAVHRTGRIFQFGTQERSSWSTRLAAELVRNGRIGKVKAITTATRFSVASPNFPPQAVPPDIDYDLWLGPTRQVAYCPQRVLNRYWFHISDHALGFIAGCGIHTVDMAQWAGGYDQTGPVAVEGFGEFPPDGLTDCATGWQVDLTYANGVTMRFTDGKRNPLGVKLEGDRGSVFVKERHLGGTVTTHPKSLLRDPIRPDDPYHAPLSNHHQQNFLDCVRTRKQPVAPIDTAVRSETIVHLSNIAMRLGRKLKWDPQAERFVGDDEANRMLSRPLRSPWKL